MLIKFKNKKTYHHFILTKQNKLIHRSIVNMTDVNIHGIQVMLLFTKEEFKLKVWKIKSSLFVLLVVTPYSTRTTLCMTSF